MVVARVRTAVVMVEVIGDYPGVVVDAVLGPP